MVEVIKLKLVAVSSWHLASYTGIHSKGRSSSRNNAWFQLFAHAWHFSRNLGNCYFGILPHKWLLLVTVMMRSHHPWLMHNLATQPRDSDWKPWRNDHVVIVFLFTLRWCRPYSKERWIGHCCRVLRLFTYSGTGLYLLLQRLSE